MWIHSSKPVLPNESVAERILDTNAGIIYDRQQNGDIFVHRLGGMKDGVNYTGDAAIALWALLLEQANPAERHLDSYISEGLVVSPEVARHTRPTLTQLIVQADSML